MHLEPHGGLGEWVFDTFRRLLSQGKHERNDTKGITVAGQLTLLARLIDNSVISKEESVTLTRLMVEWRESALYTNVDVEDALAVIEKKMRATNEVPNMKAHSTQVMPPKHGDPLSVFEELHGQEFDSTARDRCSDRNCTGIAGSGFDLDAEGQE